MPYIKPALREFVDVEIDSLIEALKTMPGNRQGNVNYTITRILKSLYTPGTYQDLNDAIGVLESIKQEFYRTVAIPYEEDKKQQNGDV